MIVVILIKKIIALFLIMGMGILLVKCRILKESDSRVIGSGMGDIRECFSGSTDDSDMEPWQSYFMRRKETGFKENLSEY